MPIAVEEYRARYGRVERSMRDAGLDLLLVYSQGNRNMYANLLYLTGYYCFDPCLQGALLISKTAGPRLVLNFDWDLDRAARTSWIDPRAMSYSRDLPGAIAAGCWELAGREARIGLVGDGYMPLALYRDMVVLGAIFVGVHRHIFVCRAICMDACGISTSQDNGRSV